MSERAISSQLFAANFTPRVASSFPVIPDDTNRGRALRLLPIFFFASGATSLMFQTIFSRLLTYTFGNTAYATSTVLAAFLGGLSLGAFLFGRWVDRRKSSLMIYGVLELLVAVFCYFIPEFFDLLTRTYVFLQHQFEFGSAGLVAVRFGLASMVILIPTVLMGGTLPVIARFVSTVRHENYESEVSRLYGWNTLGAAFGTLASTYWVMPAWGVRGTLFIACGTNLLIFLAVARLTRAREIAMQPLPDSPQAGEAPGKPQSRAFAAMLVTGAFLSGAAFYTGAVR